MKSSINGKMSFFFIKIQTSAEICRKVTFCSKRHACTLSRKFWPIYRRLHNRLEAAEPPGDIHQRRCFNQPLINLGQKCLPREAYLWSKMPTFQSTGMKLKHREFSTQTVHPGQTFLSRVHQLNS